MLCTTTVAPVDMVITNVCMFCAVLDSRIERRVDEMLDSGLVEELLQFHHHYNEQQLRDGAYVELLLAFFT